MAYLPSFIDSFKQAKDQAKKWKAKYENSQLLLEAFSDEFDLTSQGPNLAVDTEQISFLANKLAWIDEIKKDVVVIHGPRRSGKSTAALIAVNQWQAEYGPKYAQYRLYDPEFWAWWEDVDLSDTKFLVLDGVFPIWRDLKRESLENLQQRAKRYDLVVVVIISTLEYFWLRQGARDTNLTVFDKPGEFHPFSISKAKEIVEIIQSRIRWSQQRSPFSTEVIQTIAILSFGLPGLAIWLVRNILNGIPNFGVGVEVPRLELPDLEHWISQLRYIPALKLLARFSKFEKFVNAEGLVNLLGTPMKPFSESQTTILDEMLLLNHETGIIQRSELQARTGIKESSLTYSCQGLVQEKLVKYMKIGREVNYQLNSPVKEVLELIFTEKHT
ncbi:MAG: hypothetical protein ACFFE8_16525 [Candidatus Heimdallarchaeota archaeon]